MAVRTVNSVSLVSSTTLGWFAANDGTASPTAKLKLNASRKRCPRKSSRWSQKGVLAIVYELPIGRSNLDQVLGLRSQVLGFSSQFSGVSQLAFPDFLRATRHAKVI